MIELGFPNRVKVNNVILREARLFVQDAVPTETAGLAPRDEVLVRSTGDVYELSDELTWQLVANIKGPPGDTTIDEQDRQALIDAAARDVEAELEPPIDLTVLYTNAKLI